MLFLKKKSSNSKQHLFIRLKALSSVRSRREDSAFIKLIG